MILFFLNFRTVWYLFFILFPRFFCWWNSGLGCAHNYGELKPVDEILVWDVHKTMASSNRLTEFWFGICTKLWRPQTDGWNFNRTLLIMGYPRAIQIYPNDSNYYTDSLSLQHNFSPPLLVLGYPTVIYTNDKQYTTQIRFHSSIPHTITECNANINMDNTIAGTNIPRRKLNICLKGRMSLLKTIARVEQELLTLSEHMKSPPFLVDFVLLEVKFFVWWFI